MQIRCPTLSVIGLFLSTILVAPSSKADPMPCPSPVAVFSESFDGVPPSMLPWGWAVSNAVDPDGIFWVTSNSGVPLPVADSAPNAAFIDAPATVSDKRLESPFIPISNPFAQLTFRHNYNLEATFDGGVLEISLGGAFTDILTAGGSFVTGGYNSTISTAFGSPLAGRMAWSGNSGGFITTTVNLPVAAAGFDVKLRWRMASDTSVAIQGWRIDEVNVLDCPPPPTPTPPPVTVTLPTATFDNSVPLATVIIEPVMTTFIDASLIYGGFRGDFTYDSAIVSFASPPVVAAGLTATDWDVSGKVYKTGPGTLGTLSISAHSLSQTPMNGAGVLFNLRMVRVSGMPGAMSPLIWWTDPEPFVFEGLDSILYEPASAPDGLITITGPGPTPTPAPTTSPTPTPVPSPPTTAPPPITITLPTAIFDNSVPIGTIILKPVVTTFVAPNLNYIGFQGDFTFDSAIVNFANPRVVAGPLTATNWNVGAAILNTGPGTLKTLSVSAYSLDFTPTNGAGTLFNLRMVRVSSAPGAKSPLVWQADPEPFIFITGPPFSAHEAGSTPSGLITITGPGQTVSLSGSMSYCSNPSPGPVANVTLTLTGNASGATLSDGAGSYQFSSLAPAGSYIVTPTKSARPPGSPGIDTVDVLAIQRHFLQVASLSGCRVKAADVNGDNSVNTVDVQATQQFFLGRTNGNANVGKYQFTPASRTYPLVGSNQTGQNYDVLIIGDVAPSFADRPDGSVP